MDIYSYLKHDHRDINDMMERILFVRNAEQKRECFRQIKEELLLHAETEQATFYHALEHTPPITGHTMAETLADAREDHVEIEYYLEKLSMLPIESKKWLEQFGELKHAVMRHFYNEETAIFARAHSILSEEQSTQLAIDMDDLKQKKHEKAA